MRRLRQADELHGPGHGDRDLDRLRVGVADVLGGEHDHPPGDELRILAARDHHGQAVDRGVGVRSAHALDERRRDVVVVVAPLVVEQRPLARGVGHVLLRDGAAARPQPPPRRGCSARSRVAPGRLGDLPAAGRRPARPRARPRRGARSAVTPSAPSGTQLEQRAPREQGRVDLEVRVLGGRADQRDQPRLDGRQQRVLLRLVEAVDLVEEEDRPLAAARPAGRRPRRSPGGRRRSPPGRRTAPRSGPGGVGDDPRQRGLAGAGRAVEDHRADAVGLDRPPQRAVRPRRPAAGRRTRPASRAACAAAAAPRTSSRCSAESAKRSLLMREIYTESMSSSEQAQVRLGGMALRNGVLVQGPDHWAAAVRTPEGEIRDGVGPQARAAGAGPERARTARRAARRRGRSTCCRWYAAGCRRPGCRWRAPPPPARWRRRSSSPACCAPAACGR